MKYLIILLILIIGSGDVHSQSDTVWLSTKYKAIPQLNILHFQDSKLYMERYMKFKGQYCYNGTDVLVKEDFVKTPEGYINRKKKKLVYYPHGNCDSIINKIKNQSAYWKKFSELMNVSKERIGRDNEEFLLIRSRLEYQITNIHMICAEDFQKKLKEIYDQLLIEMDTIYEKKIDRLNEFKSMSSVERLDVAIFLDNYDNCDSDKKAIELLVIRYPGIFMEAVEELNDSQFFSLYLTIQNMPVGTNIQEMKMKLQELDGKSKRRKMLIKKLHL